MQDTPDGEKTAEMACTCVFALVVVVVLLATIVMVLTHV